jgi:hypothetical protein
MNRFKTGEDKTINLTIDVPAGDDISNYTQIVVTLYYLKNGKPQKFSRFALDVDAGGLPSGITFNSLSLAANIATCILPATDTDTLDFEDNDEIPIYAEVDLGLVADTGSKAKAYPENCPGEAISIGVMTKSITEGWA